MHLVDPGERVVLIADVYGGVYRMTSQVYEPKGYRFTYVPPDEFDENLAAHLGDDVRVVWVETPSNPLLNIVDIRARRRGRPRRRRDPRRRQHVRHAVPPAAARARCRPRRPLDDEVPRRALGRDRRVRRERTTTRSASGCASCRSRSARCRGRSTRGSCCAGSRRWRCACASTARTRGPVAGFLDGHPAVERVLYPGLASIRATRSRATRCATSAAWSRSSSAPRRRPSRSARGRSCSARRVARRRREPDRASRTHDARLDRRCPVRIAAQPRAPLGRHRGGRRSARRPRSGARQTGRARRPGSR